MEVQSGTTAFDFNRAVGFVHDYSKATGVGCTIIDCDGFPLYRSADAADPCRACSRVQPRMLRSGNCRKTHLYSIYHAERFGGRYIFLCPLSLMHWTSPIVVNGRTVGALLGGPVLPVEENDFYEQEFLRLFQNRRQYPENLTAQFSEVPYVPPARVKSLSEMLYVLSSYLSDGQSESFENQYEKLSITSRVSEYVHYMNKLDSSEQQALTYPIEKERRLMECIRMGDQAEAQRILNEILGYVFFASGRSIDVIRLRVLELSVLLSRAALQGGADIEQIFGLNYRYLQELDKLKSVDDIAYGLSRIMRRFTDCVFELKEVKHVDVIQRSITYIKEHYMNRITLDEISAHVSLSPAYFSRLFHQEMKITFTDFLNRYRVSKAKSLLVVSRIPLIELAALVGFEDQSYFCKVFKKTTGVSPGKFREARGEIRIAV